MKRNFEEVSTKGIDISLHAQVCLKYFQLVMNNQTSSPSHNNDGIKEAISVIYKGASVMLSDLIASNSLEVWSGSLTPEVPSSSSTNNQLPNLQQHASLGINLIKDLILVTSFICSNSHEYHSKMSKSTEKPDYNRKNTNSPLSVLIAISSYWAIATFIIQFNNDKEGNYLSQRPILRNALKTILSSKLTVRASNEISDEILICTNQLPLHKLTNNYSNETSNSLITCLLSRLKRSLRTHLKNILLFAVILSVSYNSELHSTLLHCSNNDDDEGNKVEQHEQFILKSDDNCLDIVRLIIQNVPQLALACDTGSVAATPLAYAAAYRPPSSHSNCKAQEDNNDDEEEKEETPLIEYKLALGLCKVLTEIAPSALAITDRLGMLPLHHAARKGHSAIVSFISLNYFFTVPLKDTSGKTALHHALISWKQHHPMVLLQLAGMYPKLLKESLSSSASTVINAFNPLEYAQRHCSNKVIKGLHEIILELERQQPDKKNSNKMTTKSSLSLNIELATELYQLQKDCIVSSCDNTSPVSNSSSSNVSMTTDPELSDESSETENTSYYTESSYENQDNDSFHFIQNRSIYRMKKDRDQDNLLQLADTLLMLQSATPDKFANEGKGSKKQRISY